MRYLLLALFLLLVPALFSQASLDESLERYKMDYLPEKVFVHTDKNIYSAGETIWMAVYLVDGQTGRPGTFSSLVYAELHNGEGEMIARKKLFSGGGHSAGEIALPGDLPSGDYQLTAYTNYQRNSDPETLFRKTIRILKGLKANNDKRGATTKTSKSPIEVENKINLRFFPEGGDCVNGIPCRIAFVAESPSGQPVETNGSLRDHNGALVTIFKTNEYGVGKFTYMPEEGKYFQAVLEGQGEAFNIPLAQKEGYHLSVRRPKGAVRILLKTNRGERLKGARLVLHHGGILFFDQIFKEEETIANLKFFTSDLPEGVMVATVFDNTGQPVAERLFFVAPAIESTLLQIKTDTTHFDMRQEGALQLSMPTENIKVDSMGSGRISLSIIPTQSNGGPSGDDIRTWLLLNSDVDQPIAFAQELIFPLDEQLRDTRIDELLLTRGWRRFRWEAILEDGKAFIPEYLVERGVYLRGMMGKFDSPQKPRPGKVFLIQLGSGYFQDVMTDEAGNFIFGPYDLHDVADVLLQGRFRSGKKNQLNPDIGLKDNSFTNLTILENDSPKLPEIAYHKHAVDITRSMKDYQSLSQQMLTIAQNYDSLTILLDPLEVKAKKLSPVDEDRNNRGAVYGGRPDTRLVLDSIPGGEHASSIFDLLRRVPGVLVSGGGDEVSVSIRGITSLTGSNTPTFFLDGVPTDIDVLNNYPVHDVEFIDVLKGPRAAAFGMRGASGVILVYSRRFYTTPEEPIPGMLKTKIYGFHKAREFAVFDPALPDNKNRLDIRTTLHWNADLRTDEHGLVRDTFMTSDQKGKFIIIAQGLRKDGKPFYGTSEIYVE